MKNIKMGKHEAKCLKKLLKLNSSIKKLNLSFCGIGSNIKYIAQGLKDNIGVKQLLIPDNQLCDVDFAYLSDAIKKNSVLEKLVIYQNHITDKGIKYFVEALKVNKSLKTIDMTYNNITEIGEKYVLNFMKTNSRIIKFQLSVYYDGEEILEKIGILEKRNKLIQKRLLPLKEQLVKKVKNK